MNYSNSEPSTASIMNTAPTSEVGLRRRFRLRSATALVIANMIGAGIFTTTGFQAADLGHPGYILLLWGVGGLLAFCGALCYAELGAAMPQPGAEYVYLRETYGAAMGFMSAFVSLIAGFSAPLASACKSLVRYLAYFIPSLERESPVLAGVDAPDLTAIGIVWLLVVVHTRAVRRGIGFNDLITLLKVVGIASIVLVALMVGNGSTENLTHVSSTFRQLDRTERLAAFGTSLIFVMFCYSGWNGSAYIAGEIKEPKRMLPFSLLLGPLVVGILYLGLNVVYLYGANVEELANKAGYAPAVSRLGIPRYPRVVSCSLRLDDVLGHARPTARVYPGHRYGRHRRSALLSRQVEMPCSFRTHLS